MDDNERFDYIFSYFIRNYVGEEVYIYYEIESLIYEYIEEGFGITSDEDSDISSDSMQ